MEIQFNWRHHYSLDDAIIATDSGQYSCRERNDQVHRRNDTGA